MEKRTSKRIEKNLSCIEDIDGLRINYEIKNISESGAFIANKIAFTKDSKIILLNPINNHHIEVKATVKRESFATDMNGCGVEFVYENENQKSEIKNLLKNL